MIYAKEVRQKRILPYMIATTEHKDHFNEANI